MFKNLSKRKLRSQVPEKLAKLLKGVRKQRPALADTLTTYIMTGQNAADLAKLDAADGECLEDTLRPWRISAKLGELAANHKDLSPDQWVRLGQIIGAPMIADLQADWPPVVPRWFAALLTIRAERSNETSAWYPSFEMDSLTAVGYSPAQSAHVIALAFFKLSFEDGWRIETLLNSWRRSADEPRAQELARLMLPVAGDIPALLGRLPAAQRAASIRWTGIFPELRAALTPALGEWIMDKAKTIREAALESARELPSADWERLMEKALEEAPSAAVQSLAEECALRGEDGLALLRAQSEKGGGKARLDAIRQVLERVAAAEQVQEAAQAMPDLPPLPPLNDPPPPDDLLERLVRAVEAWIEETRQRAEHYKWAGYKKQYREICGYGRKECVHVAAWLKGEVPKPPQELRSIPTSVIASAVDAPSPAVAARLLLFPDDHGLALDTFELRGRQADGQWGLDLRALVAAFEQAGLESARQRIGAEVLNSLWWWKRRDLEHIWPFFVENPELLEEALALPPTDSKPKAALEVIDAMSAVPPIFVPQLAKLALAETKALRAEAQALLSKRGDALAIAAGGLNASKGEPRTVAARWIGSMAAAGAAQGADPGDGPETAEMAEKPDGGGTVADGRAPAAVAVLREALGRERSEPVQAALLSALAAWGDDISPHLSPEALTAAAGKGLAKSPPAGMAWVPLDALPGCRWRDGGAVPPEVVRWWVVLAVKLKDPAGAGLFGLYLSLLDPPSREALGRFALDAWVARDTAHPGDQACRDHAAQQVDSRYSEYQSYARRYPDYEYYAAKGRLTRDQVFEELRREKAGEFLGSAIGEKGLLALSAGAPGHHVLAVSQRFIKDCPQRRAQVEALVVAAAQNPDPAAIQFVLSIARKFRQATVRARAAELAEEIALRRGWSMDELADRTIPTAAFEDNGVLELDYGPRFFTGRIARSPKTGAFGVQLANPAGKPIAALPKPAAGDAEDLAKEAKTQLGASKKELKQVVDLQTARLYEAMCAQRAWDAAVWLECLAGHPVMRHLVATLVWVHREGNGPARLFRPTQEGEFLNAEDDAVPVAPNGTVRLAHRALVSPEEADQWRAHLADYGVRPLFDQFGAPDPQLQGDLGELEKVDTRKGWLSDTFAIRGRANKRGYARADAEDGGWFTSYRKEFPAAGLTACVDFTGSGLPEELIPAAVTVLRFEDAYGDPVKLAQIPPVLLAETHADYTHIAEAGQYDKDWEKKSAY
ncbi:MAG: DUF4132 domain-containing protein [Bifidobacteriaceae bacterium]|nr:DUF4132 domain-containing protein [Bifidobacteriaceae bacterium]